MTEKIQFVNDDDNYYNATITIGNTIKVIFDKTLPPNNILSNGFATLNEYNNKAQGHFENYKYYRKDDDCTVLFAKNEEDLIIPPAIETDLYIPTEEELLEQERQYNITNLQIQIQSLKTGIANYDYIFLKRQEINQIEDEVLRNSQLEKYQQSYSSERLQLIIVERISLRENIDSLELELSLLIK